MDYLGEQFVIEMKIWSGSKYHADGEAQTMEYLDYYRLKKGYMVIFNFNKHKETGVKEVRYGLVLTPDHLSVAGTNCPVCFVDAESDSHFLF